MQFRQLADLNAAIWDDDPGTPATEPIDVDLNSHTVLLASLQMTMALKRMFHTISDMAFDAVDNDKSGNLDEDEIGLIMREVARSMGITPLNHMDINFVMNELDANSDGTVDKCEFIELVILVLGKMLESEESQDDIFH